MLTTAGDIKIKQSSFNPLHIVWMAVIISELFTAVLNTIQSLLWFGEISFKLLVIGAIDAAFVPLLVTPIVIYFMMQTDELKNLNAQLSTEIAERRRIGEEKDRLYNERIAEKERHLEEKERLLMDLHDGVGGIATNIRLLSELSQVSKDFVSVKKTLTTISQLSQDAISEIRSLMQSLDGNELSWQTLAATLRKEGAAIVEPHGLSFEIQTEMHEVSTPSSSLLWMNLLKIYKEALRNAIKHARASAIAVTFNVADHGLILRVQDDGIGCDGSAQSGRGLAIMKKRAGDLGGAVCISAPGRGTQVSLAIPFPVHQVESKA